MRNDALGCMSMNTSYRKLLIRLIMGAAPAVSTRLPAADSPVNTSTRAADILKSSLAVYRNPNLTLSCQIYRRSLRLRVHEGDGSSTSDYDVTDSNYQMATLRVRAPYALYMESKFYSSSGAVVFG